MKGNVYKVFIFVLIFHKTMFVFVEVSFLFEENMKDIFPLRALTRFALSSTSARVLPS